MTIDDITLDPRLEVFLLSTGDLESFLHNKILNPLSHRNHDIHVVNIAQAFDWENTKEGFDYWWNKNNLFIDHFGIIE